MQRIGWFELNNRKKKRIFCTKPIEKYIPLTQNICKTMQNTIKYEKD